MDLSCPFCDLSKFIGAPIYESENFHLMAGLGQIAGGYVYVFPKEHLACIGAIDNTDMAYELELLASSLCAVISCEYGSPVTIFEHGIVGQTIKHAHLHFLPVRINVTARINKDFPLCEKNVVGSFRGLSALYGKNLEPYLFWIAPNESPQICWSPPAPPQYFRTVAAEEVGHPERANWKTMNEEQRELDKKLWRETADRLKPYFA